MQTPSSGEERAGAPTGAATPAAEQTGSARPKALVRALPVLMFVVFATFWCSYDIVLGLWLALAPSALVGALVVAKLLVAGSGGTTRALDRGGAASQERP